MSGRLQLVPLDLAEANAFVARHHRHHGPVVGHRFSIGAALGDLIVGVAIIGRPVARRRDDGMTLEVTRLCTDGIKRPIGKANRKGEPCFINAASFLYAAAIRAAWALGYTRIGTYLLDTETGASLKAAGWREVGKTPGRSWSVPSRPRVDTHPLQPRLIFEATRQPAEEAEA